MIEQAWLATYLDSLAETTGRIIRYVHIRLGEDGGLSPSQHFLLYLLHVGGSRTVSDLAAHLGMTAAGATGLIDRMVKANLVERYRDESDRRVVWVKLGTAGAERLAETQRQRRKIMAEIYGVLDRTEVATLVDLHRKIAAAIPATVGPCNREEVKANG